MDSATAEIQQTAANAASNASKIRADVAQIQNEVDTNKSATSASVDELKSDIGSTQTDLNRVRDSLAKSQSAVQGDMTVLQKDISGIKLTIADHDKNINTLQADSKTLKDDMADAKGNISSLQKTATSLDSEFKDHDGRLSKVEQTASTLTNEFSDEQGHLNRVEQTAQGTQQTVANQQGQINNIKTDAAGIHETLTGQGNQIANINVTLSGLNSKYEGVSGDLGKLKSQVTTNSTQITQNKQAIALKADQSTVNNLSGEVSQNSAQLKVQAGQISSKVSSEDFNTLDNKVGGAIAQIDKNTTAIDQNNKQISLKADQTEVDKIKETASYNSSRLDVMNNEIKSKVSSTDVNNIVDGKGYATTSTVQSLITQKAGTINESITSLEAKYNTTVTQVQSLTASIDGLQSTVSNKADKSQITQLSNVIQSKVSSSDFNDLKDKTLWKSTDSIDLNTAVSQQKIFVKGGSNLPPGGYWWYVRVEPGYASRIAQYAVSDHDNLHYSRQYDGSKWSAWSQGATESEITQLRDDINLRVKSGDLLSQINLTAHNTLIQSNKIYLDSSSTVFSGKAFIPSAAITSLEADKITTGTLNGVHIHQIANANGRSIDIANGNISLNSSDPYEPRITFNYQGKETKMFNAVGDLEADSFSIFNFSPYDTSSLHPIKYFDVTNTGGRGSGNASMHLDHAIINGHEWWASADGITFGRSYDGQNTSSTYVDLYAKSFDPHSQLSSKTRIERLDGQKALDTIMADDMYTYQYKSDVASGSTKRYASLIIDDVNDVKQYRSPKIFIADNGKCRDDGTQLAYLIAAFQYQHQVINELTDKVNQLEEKING